MHTGTLLIIALLLPLGGCVATPRMEVAERLDFNAPPPDQATMSYEDMLCCYDCNA